MESNSPTDRDPSTSAAIFGAGGRDALCDLLHDRNGDFSGAGNRRAKCRLDTSEPYRVDRRRIDQPVWSILLRRTRGAPSAVWRRIPLPVRRLRPNGCICICVDVPVHPTGGYRGGCTGVCGLPFRTFAHDGSVNDGPPQPAPLQYLPPLRSVPHPSLPALPAWQRWGSCWHC